MTILSIPLLAGYLLILPLLAGAPAALGDALCLTKRKGSRLAGAALSWEYGMILMMAAYEIVSVPLILLHLSLTASIIAWHLLLGVWTVVMLCFCRRKRCVRSEGNAVFAGRLEESGAWTGYERIWFAFLVLCIAFQCGVYILGMHLDADDARYVANALAARDTNTMYRFHPNNGMPMEYFMGEVGKEVTSPLMMYYASLSVLTGIHPTIMIHTVLPPFLLLLSYLALWSLSAEIWPGDRKRRFVFLMVNCVIRIMGNTSIYTGSTFTLIRIWQGKALVPAVIVPLIVAAYMGFYLRRQRPDTMFLLLLANLTACLSSGMGIYLSAILTAVCAAACLVHLKSIKTPFLMLLCCIPNAVYTGIYLLVHKVILR